MIKLPRLNSTSTLIDRDGKALRFFTRLWDAAMSKIEEQLTVPLGEGFVVTIGDNAPVVRTMAAGTGLSVTNADGQAGNPSYSLNNTTVTAGSYGDGSHVAVVTIDAQGRITSASEVAIEVTAADIGLDNVSNKAQLPLDGTDAMQAPIKLKSYAVGSFPASPGANPQIAYASNGCKNGEGAGAGTGVLVFWDGSNWCAVDTGAPVTS